MNTTTTNSTYITTGGIVTPNTITTGTTAYASSSLTLCDTYVKPTSDYLEEILKKENEHKKPKNKTVKITDVEEIVPGKVVRCTFSDGDVQKAVCCDEDTYTLEAGISICIAKHLLGGTSQYNKAIRQGVDCYNKKLKAEEEKKIKEEQKKRRKNKYEAYKKRRDEKKRKQHIRDQIEIFSEVFRNINNKV